MKFWTQGHSPPGGENTTETVGKIFNTSIQSYLEYKTRATDTIRCKDVWWRRESVDASP